MYEVSEDTTPFYRKERPFMLKIKGGELRLYRESKKLCISKKPWKDEEGVERIGKTVTVDLDRNQGNNALLFFLDAVKDILQGDNATDQEEGKGAGQ